MKRIHSRSAGFSLLEVMIAVVVLAFGLVSLAALQGRLFQSGAESKARAAATAIAQQSLEDARSFAFVAPPAGYTGPTYTALDDGGPWTFSAGGVDFTAERTVKRYRYVDTTPSDGVLGQFVEDTDTVNATGNYSGGVPEFKQVDVSVSWTGSDGEDKTVLLTDSIAAVAPADAAMLRKPPAEAMDGPQVWIEPPNKNNPQVVPIGIGDNQSAASSNPQPEQFAKSDAAVTRFSVMTFTGNSDTQVLLNRKVDVSVATCVCQADGNSTAINPTYQPTVWNGIQRAYVAPQPLPTGTPIGAAVVANADSEIEPTCTVCCRDHHENAKRIPRPDPWRALTADEEGGSEHYTRAGGTLAPAGDGQYVDSCQVIRVGGLLRVAVDAMQNNLVVTPLDDARTGYRIGDFGDRYAGYVTDTIEAGMAALPAGYPSPTARLAAPSATLQEAYADIVDPDPIALADGDEKALVAFGLYVDYLSPETRTAYDCALNDKYDGECAGLGGLDPLQVLPFYAVNVANLGDGWTSRKPDVATVTNREKQDDGTLGGAGVVTAGDGDSADEFKVDIKINKSNSGLAGSWTVDPDDDLGSSTPDIADDAGDDANPTSYAQDGQGFTKGGTNTNDPTYVLHVILVNTGNNLVNGISMALDGAPCSAVVGTEASCSFTPSAVNRFLTIGGFSDGAQANKDRQVCVGLTSTTQGDATATESQTLQLGTLNVESDYTLRISIIKDTETCNPPNPVLVPNS